METKRILGLDTGTNSLGWALIDRTGDNCRLIARGVHIFPEGVKIEKGVESSKASERTGHRALRRAYYRRKLRKLRLLRILSDNGLCPTLSQPLLSAWRLRKIYPATDDFMSWQATDDIAGKNPYADRCDCLHRKLNLDTERDRYKLGRALYHIAQRRGFRSNRKSEGKDNEDGKVKSGIDELSKAIEREGCTYLAEYFLKLYQRGERIRTHYTSRDSHYLEEFKAICRKQELNPELTEKLEKAIFSQRPLKSQKTSVGKCPFEPSKTRCHVTHPDFEEFRMLQFINNIRIRTDFDSQPRPLSADERKAIIPLFMRKSKKTFDFGDIAKALIKKSGHAQFNYPSDLSVSGCPVTAALASIFGSDWQRGIAEVYVDAKDKSISQITDDIWHVLHFFENADKLRQFAIDKLQLNEKDATSFSKITMPEAYGSLSRKAISKMLPLLRKGLIYPHAALLANLGSVMPPYEWNIEPMREAAIDKIVHHLEAYDPKTTPGTLEKWLKDFLKETYHVTDEALKELYHPSRIETYPKAQPDNEGLVLLGSPRVSAIRNPMAMRSLHQIRHLVNALLRKGLVDETTEIHIEFARELNDSNTRQAIYRENRENEKQRAKHAIAIAEHLGIDASDVSERDLLKYRLWTEQKGICLYTGNQIGIADLFGSNPKYDIEHTIPRSAGGDSTLENLTLCDARFNRETKKTRLPSELPNYDEIIERVKFMKEKADELTKRIRRLRTDPSMDKAKKDGTIQKRRSLELERRYWLSKYHRFKMESVPEGFSRRQGAGIGLISRYSRLFLQSVFQRVDTVKGAATADFRKAWGIQEEYTRKSRVNHTHHLIDAIVIACIDVADYQKLATAYRRDGYHDREKVFLPLPWSTFKEDIQQIQLSTLVSSDTPDNMHKRGRRRIGDKIHNCDAARASLHLDTIYGAVKCNDAVKYAVRVPLSSFKSEKDIEKIIDPVVREKVRDAVARLGFKEAMASTIWMNEEKRIPIKKVRCYVPSITRPIALRKLRDISPKEYRRHHYVANDGNYALAIYAGKDAKGKEKRTFTIINNLEAATNYAAKSRGQANSALMPQTGPQGLPLLCILKRGTKVLLYEESPEELWQASPNELQRRLYRITGLTSMIISKNTYARITMTHNQEARPSTELKVSAGAYSSGEALRPSISMLHTQLKALVEGQHFTLDILGNISFIK